MSQSDHGRPDIWTNQNLIMADWASELKKALDSGLNVSTNQYRLDVLKQEYDRLSALGHDPLNGEMSKSEVDTKYNHLRTISRARSSQQSSE